MLWKSVIKEPAPWEDRFLLNFVLTGSTVSIIAAQTDNMVNFANKL